MKTFKLIVKILPGVYVLTTNMTALMYNAMWQKLFSLIPSLKENVKYMSIDYERAALKSIKDTFGDSVKILICLFHHEQVR